MYTAQQPRKRFNFRLSENERDQLNHVMQSENIPDISKAIRYCIAEKAAQLQAVETPQKEKGAA